MYGTARSARVVARSARGGRGRCRSSTPTRHLASESSSSLAALRRGYIERPPHRRLAGGCGCCGGGGGGAAWSPSLPELVESLALDAECLRCIVRARSTRGLRNNKW